MVVFLDQGSFDIGKHLDNDYADGELDREATRKYFFIVRFEGDRLAERASARRAKPWSCSPGRSGRTSRPPTAQYGDRPWLTGQVR